MLFLLIVRGSSFLCLVLFTGLVLGVSFSFLIWIVLLLIYVGKFHMGSFYTAERLAGFGYAHSTACFCSVPVESLQLLFFHCPLAVSVLCWLQSIMFLASPLCPSILVCHVLFGFSADELSAVPPVLVYMLNVCKFCIWGARNDFCFRGVRPLAVDVMERVKSRVRFYLPLSFRHFRSDRRRHYFVRQWGAGGVVASLHNDAFQILVTSRILINSYIVNANALFSSFTNAYPMHQTPGNKY